MSILDELQVGLVPLLQALQQQPLLGPLQLQLPHLERAGGWGGGLPGPPGEALQPSSLAPAARSSSVLHLGLQLRQPGLALQKVGLELGGAAPQLHLCGQELPLIF